jgi:hypothetical protein
MRWVRLAVGSSLEAFSHLGRLNKRSRMSQNRAAVHQIDGLFEFFAGY